MQQLRKHYEAQHTEILLDIAKKHLTDEARIVLGEVLSNRGVAPEQIEAAKHAFISEQAAALEEENRLASRWKRLLAFAIDVWGAAIVLFVVLLPLRFLSLDLHFNAVTLLWLAYFLLRDSIPGQGIGKRLLGLRVVHEQTGRACSWLQSVSRNLLHIAFMLDALFAFGRRRMRLGDALAGTVVINRSAPSA